MASRKPARPKPAPEPIDEDSLKARLLAPRTNTESGMPEEDYELDGVGTIRIRALSRTEVLRVKDLNKSGAEWGKSEILMLSLAMVNPEMTQREVMDWQRVGVGGEFDKLCEKVSRISGMLEESPKEIYKSV